MKLQLLIFLLAFVNTLAVGQLDYGHVKGNKPLCTQHKRKPCACDSMGNPVHICESKYEMEIRLNYSDSNVALLYVLSYDTLKNWEAHLIVDSIKYVNFNKEHTGVSPRAYSLTPKISFENIFNELKKNKIFRLSGLTDLVSTKEYLVTYKAGHKINRYYFSDPSMLKRLNSKNQVRSIPKNQIDNYANISDIFFTQFKLSEIRN